MSKKVIQIFRDRIEWVPAGITSTQAKMIHEILGIVGAVDARIFDLVLIRKGQEHSRIKNILVVHGMVATVCSWWDGNQFGLLPARFDCEKCTLAMFKELMEFIESNMQKIYFDKT